MLLYSSMPNLILQELLFLKVFNKDCRYILIANVIFLDTCSRSCDLKRLFFFLFNILLRFFALLFYSFIKKSEIVLVFRFGFCILSCFVGIFPLF